jgi:hypothetical protein
VQQRQPSAHPAFRQYEGFSVRSNGRLPPAYFIELGGMVAWRGKDAAACAKGLSVGSGCYAAPPPDTGPEAGGERKPTGSEAGR